MHVEYMYRIFDYLKLAALGSGALWALLCKCERAKVYIYIAYTRLHIHWYIYTVYTCV